MQTYHTSMFLQQNKIQKITAHIALKKENQNYQFLKHNIN